MTVVVLAAGAATVGAGSATAATTSTTDTATSAAPAPAPAEYVALGDSYTSGPGIAPAVPGSGQCNRSSNDYPALTAAALKLTLDDVSCGGATTVSVLKGSSGLAPQLDAVTAATKVVSVGIGGNDVGLLSIYSTCFAWIPWSAPCTSRVEGNGVDQIAPIVAGAQAEITGVLTAIHAKAPNAKIFLTDYADIVPTSGNGCWPIVPFTPGDVNFINTSEIRLDLAMQAAAKAAGTNFVDFYLPSVGHDACMPVGTRWIEPEYLGGYPLHPNALAMRSEATILAAAMTAAGVTS
jgi:lysophospholipase L1-like esterase